MRQVQRRGVRGPAASSGQAGGALASPTVRGVAEGGDVPAAGARRRAAPGSHASEAAPDGAGESVAPAAEAAHALGVPAARAQQAPGGGPGAGAAGDERAESAAGAAAGVASKGRSGGPPAAGHEGAAGSAESAAADPADPAGPADPADPTYPADGPGGRWFVLLDAAKAVASRPPDLTAAPADFAVRAADPGMRGCLPWIELCLYLYYVMRHPLILTSTMTQLDSDDAVQTAVHAPGTTTLGAVARGQARQARWETLQPCALRVAHMQAPPQP